MQSKITRNSKVDAAMYTSILLVIVLTGLLSD